MQIEDRITRTRNRIGHVGADTPVAGSMRPRFDTIPEIKIITLCKTVVNSRLCCHPGHAVRHPTIDAVVVESVSWADGVGVVGKRSRLDARRVAGPHAVSTKA